MRLPLDTHALLWYALGDPQLSKRAETLILDPANEVLVSAASFWEIAIKVSIGKLPLHRPYEEFVDACLTGYRFTVLPVEPRHKTALISMAFHHRDPFDRMLAAQALTEGIAVVSADAALDPYGVTRLWECDRPQEPRRRPPRPPLE
ncbi:MAG: type II toxin-antitoxin system VapC family toxin [Gemmataceae bacterium]